MREREKEREWERAQAWGGAEAEGETDPAKQEVQCRTLGSWPELKADAQRTVTQAPLESDFY